MLRTGIELHWGLEPQVAKLPCFSLKKIKKIKIKIKKIIIKIQM
jgi:hypothetical protein